MEIETVAKCLAELGNPSRLSAFHLLVKAGPQGLPVKDIQAHLGIPQSTLSHHLSHLMSAGLVTQTREGRVLRCRVEYGRVRDVLSFLLKDCCAGIVDPRQL
ncbi:MAG: metalloregulator ArsR/SmtB family transcription factor [Thermodesulfobacteriota bacterium]